MVELRQDTIDILHYAYSGCLSDPNAFVASYLHSTLNSAGDSLAACLHRLGTSQVSVDSNLNRCVTEELNANFPNRNAPEAPVEISLPPSNPDLQPLPAFSPRYRDQPNEGYVYCRTLENRALSYLAAGQVAAGRGATYQHQMNLARPELPSGFRNLDVFLDRLRDVGAERIDHPPAPIERSTPEPTPTPSQWNTLAYGFTSNFLSPFARPEITREAVPTTWLRSANLLLLEAGWIHEWRGMANPLHRDSYSTRGFGTLAMLGLDGNGVSALGAFLYQWGQTDGRRYQVRAAVGWDFGLNMPRVGLLFAIASEGTLSTCALQGVLFPWAMVNPNRFAQCLRHSREYPSIPDSSVTFMAGAFWNASTEQPIVTPYIGFSFRPFVKQGWIIDLGFTVVNLALPRL